MISRELAIRLEQLDTRCQPFVLATDWVPVSSARPTATGPVPAAGRSSSNAPVLGA